MNLPQLSTANTPKRRRNGKISRNRKLNYSTNNVPTTQFSTLHSLLDDSIRKTRERESDSRGYIKHVLKSREGSVKVKTSSKLNNIKKRAQINIKMRSISHQQKRCSIEDRVQGEEVKEKKRVVRRSLNRKSITLRLKSAKRRKNGTGKGERISKFQDKIEYQILEKFEKLGGEVYENLDESQKHCLLEKCLRYVKEEHTLDLERMKVFTKLMVDGLFLGVKLKSEEVLYTPQAINITSLNKGKILSRKFLNF